METNTFSTIDKKLLEWSETANNLIGKGNFASVFKGLYDRKECAIKKFDEFSYFCGIEVRTIAREACILSLLRHNNIISFIGFDFHDGLMVCELGLGSLHDVLHREKRFNFLPEIIEMKMKLNWLLEISRALRYLHFNGITHSDIKPHNILVVAGSVNGQATVKLSDFGISGGLAIGCVGARRDNGAGTHAYMAPELIIGGYPQPGVDIYSFGVLANEMISEEVPWKGMKSTQIIVGVLKKLRPKLFMATNDSESELLAIIGDISCGCLSQTPDERFDSFELEKRLCAIVNALENSEVVKSSDDVDIIEYSAKLSSSYQLLAEQGDAVAQCQAGIGYLIGKGTGLSIDTNDLYLYKRLCLSDEVLNTSISCNDDDIDVNLPLAFKYFMKSAALGYAAGQVCLGHCYLYGKGTEMSEEEALKQFKSAFDQNHPLGYWDTKLALL